MRWYYKTGGIWLVEYISRYVWTSGLPVVTVHIGWSWAQAKGRLYPTACWLITGNNSCKLWCASQQLRQLVINNYFMTSTTVMGNTNAVCHSLSSCEKFAHKVLSDTYHPIHNDFFKCRSYAKTRSTIRSIPFCVNVHRKAAVSCKARVLTNREQVVTDFLHHLSRF